MFQTNSKMKTAPAIPKRRLYFDIDGKAHWDGIPLEPPSYLEVLDDFAAVVSWQLAAEAERRLSPGGEEFLAYTGSFRKFAGLPVISKLLSEIEGSLLPADYFHDRLEKLPPQPARPVAPNPPKTRLPGSMAEAIERARYEREQKDYQIALAKWREAEAVRKNRQPELVARVRKSAEYRVWCRILVGLENAKSLIEHWRKVLREAGTIGGDWIFLPPGPWLDYRECWLREWFARHHPKVEFDFERLVVLTAFQPMVMVHGSLGGAEGYTAYLFRSGKVALESPKIGHALYFFHRDWAGLSRRPKGELIRLIDAGDNRLARFIHSKEADLAAWLKRRLT